MAIAADARGRVVVVTGSAVRGAAHQQGSMLTTRAMAACAADGFMHSVVERAPPGGLGHRRRDARNRAVVRGGDGRPGASGQRWVRTGRIDGTGTSRMHGAGLIPD
ncbi:MAG TPA: hypothetical protein VK929_00410 [Longimicrobiales bacterium]|nr:hypothetical protein [Longimicrobiales bacterium]